MGSRFAFFLHFLRAFFDFFFLHFFSAAARWPVGPATAPAVGGAGAAAAGPSTVAFHSSEPVTPSTALKKSVPATSVSWEGADPFPGAVVLMSRTSVAPAPLLFQSSVP